MTINLVFPDKVVCCYSHCGTSQNISPTDRWTPRHQPLFSPFPHVIRSQEIRVWAWRHLVFLSAYFLQECKHTHVEPPVNAQLLSTIISHWHRRASGGCLVGSCWKAVCKSLLEIHFELENQIDHQSLRRNVKLPKAFVFSVCTHVCAHVCVRVSSYSLYKRNGS